MKEKAVDDQAELEARRPVWIALSELFLDTDVRIWYAAIAATLADSPYSEDELRMILDHELTPVLQANLLQVAGEWAAFDEEWLVEEAARRRGKRRLLPALVNLDDDWRALSFLLGRLRALPDAAARSRRLAAWNALLPLLLSKDPAWRPPPEGVTPAELDAAFQDDLAPALREQARKLAVQDAATYPSLSEIDSNWRRYRAQLA